MLEQIIGEYDREPLLKRLEEADVPATPVNTVDQVMNDPQTIARGMIERVDASEARRDPRGGHAAPVLAHEPGVRRAAPMRGEHTDAVLGRVRAVPRAHPRAARQEGHSLRSFDGGSHHVRSTQARMPSADEALPGRAARHARARAALRQRRAPRAALPGRDGARALRPRLLLGRRAQVLGGQGRVLDVGRLRRRLDAEPDLRGGLQRPHRPHRGRARGLRPARDRLRRPAAHLLGGPRPDAGHAPGQ